MPTPIEIRETLKQRIDRINAPMTSVAKIAQMSVPQISNFIAGRFNVPLERLQHLHRCIEGMERLTRDAQPIPVSFDNADVIRSLIQKVQSGNLDISIVDRTLLERIRGGVVGLNERPVESEDFLFAHM